MFGHTRLAKQQQKKDCLKNQKVEDVMKRLYEHLLGLFECDSPYWTPGRMRFHLRTHSSNGLQLCPQLTPCSGRTASTQPPKEEKYISIPVKRTALTVTEELVLSKQQRQ